MKEDVSTSIEGTPLSTIFKELAKLERDFRYQETVHKIKSEELDKAIATNIILKEHLESAYVEIESLRNSVQTLDVKFTELDIGCEQEKDVCEQVIQKLTGKISSMNDEHKTTLQKQDSVFKQAKTAMQEKHDGLVKDLQRKFGDDLLEFEQELERERNHSKQLQSKLDFTIEDNLLLQGKLREVHNDYLPLEAYKTQLRNLSTSNEKLKSQCSHLKTECKTIMTENARLQKHNVRLNQVNSTYNEERERKNLEHQGIVSCVQSQLNEMIGKYELKQSECEILREENALKLQALETCNGEDYCNVETHRNIAEQNKILQELVKEMRKERINCTGDQLQTNLNETEERIERLEELIYELKKVLANKPQVSSSTSFC